MAIGPVQLIVLGFEHPDFHGEIIAELERLRESDTVRVIDALAVRDGFVTDEFVDLARTDPRTPEQEARLTALKAEMAERVMAAPAEAVYLAE